MAGALPFNLLTNECHVLNGDGVFCHSSFKWFDSEPIPRIHHTPFQRGIPYGDKRIIGEIDTRALRAEIRGDKEREHNPGFFSGLFRKNSIDQTVTLLLIHFPLSDHWHKHLHTIAIEYYHSLIPIVTISSVLKHKHPRTRKYKHDRYGTIQHSEEKD